jgi:hypothetical protein
VGRLALAFIESPEKLWLITLPFSSRPLVRSCGDVNENRSSTSRDWELVVGFCERAFRERFMGCTSGAMFGACGDGGDIAIGCFALVDHHTLVGCRRLTAFRHRVGLRLV